jgi:lipoyl(octanoyl) transferase
MKLPKEDNPNKPYRDAALQVYLLGTVDFEAALLFQRRLHYEISGDRDQAALILCEHAPLITVGREGSRGHIHFEPEELQTRRWPTRWVNRGGGCLLHLPGQLAIYPIFPLDSLALSVTSYVNTLGMTLLDTLTDFHLTRPPHLGPAGVLSGTRLVGAVGVAVRDWVSYFGAYLNIHPWLDPFRKIHCDPHSQEPMTSLERERRGPIRPALVRERMIEHMQTRFGFSRVALFSDHPFLQGHLQRCQPPAEYSTP